MIDAHAHYDDHAFDEDRDTLLPYLHENGVEVIINSGAERLRKNTILFMQLLVFIRTLQIKFGKVIMKNF